MNAYEIPLTPVPQTFAIDLLGTTYRLTLSWCDPQGAWGLDIADAGGSAIVQGIPLVTGTDLLKQYAYLGLPGGLYAQGVSSSDDPPNFDTLGLGATLFLVTP